MNHRLLTCCLLSAAPALAAAPQDQATALPPAFPPAAPAEFGIPAEALEELSALVRDLCQREKILGAELLVIQDRRTILHQGFGWRDRDAGLPMESGTIFNLRSMTKAVMGTAAQILIDEGKLALDDRVAEHLPAFDTEQCRGITVDQILSHRAGFPLTILTALDEYPDLQAQAAAVAARGPEHPPGSKFWYSDAGADVLGALIEAVSGEPLADFVRRRVLEPLGMRDSFFTAPPDDPRWDRVASLYGGTPGAWARFWQPDGASMYPFAWGSQSLYGTPEDYCRFLAMWLDGGLTASGERLVSERGVASQLEPVSPMTALGSPMSMPTGFPGLEVWYGRMAVLYRRPGAAADTPSTVIGHSGSDGTIAWAWPERDLIAAVFTQSRGSTAVLRFETEIHRLLIDPTVNDQVPASWKAFLGIYTPRDGILRGKELEVLIQNGKLGVDVPGQIVFELSAPDPEGWRSFEIDPRLKLRFVVEEDGSVGAFEFQAPGQDRPGLVRRGTAAEFEAALAKEAAAAELGRYLGVYQDVEGDAEVRMIELDGQLAASHPAVPMPLKFAGPDEDGFWTLELRPAVRIRFTENEDGEITGYEVHAGGRVVPRPRLRDLDPPEGGERQAMKLVQGQCRSALDRLSQEICWLPPLRCKSPMLQGF